MAAKARKARIGCATCTRRARRAGTEAVKWGRDGRVRESSHGEKALGRKTSRSAAAESLLEERRLKKMIINLEKKEFKLKVQYNGGSCTLCDFFRHLL